MKKKSAIKDIFNGVRGDAETMRMPKNDSENVYIIRKSREQLEQRLSPEMYELLCKHVDAIEDNHSDEVDFYFVEGFKLGLLIGIECMED